MWGGPDWQLRTMRFFCYQEEQSSSGLGFPEWLHQYLSEKLCPCQSYSGPGLLRGEQQLWFKWNTSLKELCDSHIFRKRNPGPRRNPSRAAGWGNADGGDDPTTTSQVLGRLKARVRGKDPMLFRILSTEFLLLEQIYSFWMRFTKQNASEWVPTQNKFCN